MALGESSMIPSMVKSNSGYGDGPAYWNERYREGQGISEWVGRWEDVAEAFCRATAGSSRDQAQILHAGCGNSSLAEDMYAAGFHQITSIDSSDVVIEQMTCRSKDQNLNGLRWLCMDATQMEFSDWSFDAVLDKALVDALLCADNAEFQVARYLKEVIRVLRPEGVFFCISLNPARAKQLEAAPWCFRLEETLMLGKDVVCTCRKTQASVDFLERWPSICHGLSRGASYRDFEFVDAEGTWGTAVGLAAGDVVEVASAFTSGEEPGGQVRLEAGLRGIVRVVDEDGDAIIRFPRLLCADGVDRFVLQAQLENLRRRLPPNFAEPRCGGSFGETSCGTARSESEEEAASEGSGGGRPRPGFPQPWEHGRPQPDVAALQRESPDILTSPVLDVGGDSTAWLASLGLRAASCAASASALAEARQRLAAARGRREEGSQVFADASFVACDILEEPPCEALVREGPFASALDGAVFCGLGGGPERRRYARVLAALLRPGGRLVLLACSDGNAATTEDSPLRRVSKDELREIFTEASGWEVEEIREARYCCVRPSVPGKAPQSMGFGAWLMVARRL